MQQLKLGFSTCPNDTFMFDALVHRHIPLRRAWDFDLQLEDIKTLNQLAKNHLLDVAKVSFFAFSFIQNDWTLLDAGAALGRGVGPLLVAGKNCDLSNLSDKTIAIPGLDTTANLLLHFFLPRPAELKPMLFHEIMPAVASGKADLGLIIHESRFTYQDYGLNLVQDLGTYWEEKTGLPIPLGGIIAHNSLGVDLIADLEADLKDSVRFALENPEVSLPFVRQHAQEMAEDVMQKHIQTYVNPHSVSLGKEGKDAVKALLQTAERIKARISV